MIRPPPDPFPAVYRQRLPAGSQLHRIHSAARAANGFNPGKGRPTRFAPLVRSDGSPVPTAYAAMDYESAAHETIFHEIPFDAARKRIRESRIRELSHSVLGTRRELILAGLFEPDLNAWRLSRHHLIDTLAEAYPETARWALAIHDRWPDVDGLVWTSRRCDPRQAYLLFGDRVAEADLEPLAQRRISDSDEALADLRGFAERAGITIIV
jgi:hypothetical protein